MHGGDNIDELEGSLNGTLYAFHTYWISVWAAFGTESYVDPYTFPSATGQVHLAFVPEPGTLMLLATGLAFIGVRGRRIRPLRDVAAAKSAKQA
jgi:hypothetical protein